MGWLTVFAYFFTFFISTKVLRTGTKIFDQQVLSQKNLWLFIVIAMFLLGINKQLDLQSFFGNSLKYMAIENGWNQQRHKYQLIFIYAISALGIAGISGLFILYRKVLKQHILAIAGLCLIVVFVLIRASSFHHVDILLNTRLAGLRMNWILELGGISLICINAYRLAWSR